MCVMETIVASNLNRLNLSAGKSIMQFLITQFFKYTNKNIFDFTSKNARLKFTRESLKEIEKAVETPKHFSFSQTSTRVSIKLNN